MKYIRKLMIPTFFIVIVIAIIPLSYTVTWSGENPFTTWGFFDGLPYINQMANGDIWIVWEIVVDYYADIAYSIYDGERWSYPDLMTTDPANDIGPCIFQASNGTIFLFWASERHGTYDIFYSTSSDWSNKVRLTNDTRDDTGVSAMQTADGKIWVVWQREFSTTHTDLYYMTYNGTSWTSEEPVFTSLVRNELPSITQMADGNIWIAYCSTSTGDYEIYYRVFNGTSWSDDDHQRTISSDMDVDPAIIQARDGAIWIIWTSCEDKETARDNVYYMISSDNGTNWSASSATTANELTIPKNTYDNMWSSVAQLNNKTLCVAFTSDRNDNFDIYTMVSSEIIVHDVAITGITPSPTVVDPGEIVSIDVEAENQGDMAETFNVTCYVDSTQIGSETVFLSAQDSTTLTFPWDTSTYAVGVYTISANASTVPNETPINTDDNLFIDGTVQVAGHDLATIDVYTSEPSVAQGFILQIYVKVKNEGTIAETFNVTAYYDSTPIEPKKEVTLDPNTLTTVTFDWNTTGVSYGNHVISATAEQVPGESDTSDNSMTDGTVQVKIPGDVDGDEDVDIDDLMYIARALGTDPRYPLGTDWNHWNPDCDINNDLMVNSFDLYITGKNYGQTVE